MIARRTLAALAMSALAALFPLTSLAANTSLEQILAKTLAPQAGGVATFQIALTPGDNTPWPAGSYTVTLTATDSNGNVVVTSQPVAGDEAVTPQSTTMVFVDLTLPPGYLGPLAVRAHLVHGKIVEDSAPAAIVVGGSVQNASIVPAASPPPGQVPAPGQPAPLESAAPAGPTEPVAAPSPAQNVTGSLVANAGYGLTKTQSTTLNLTGKLANNQSLTVAEGLANTPGANRPLISFQTSQWLTQIGNFSPTFDRDAFAGPSGAGIGFKEQIDPVHVLQGAYISGSHDTTNPFEIEGLSYGFPMFGSPISITGGYENVYGPAQAGPFFLRSGGFFGFGQDVHAPHSTITYGVHYGVTSYRDDDGDTSRFGQVFDLAFGFAIRKAQFAFTYVRATPFFANTSAPGVTADRETETAAVTIPMGAFQVTLGANAYRDDLPGSTLLQTTHYSTENIGVAYSFKGGDQLTLQGVNGIQHQTGDPVAPFSGNNGTTLAYTTKRGPFAIQYSLAGTETRDDSGNLLHVITNGITVSRDAFAGLTISGGFNVNQNDANVETGTTQTNSGTVSVSYTRGAFTLSTQANHALSHPFVGLSTPPTTTYNYGLSIKPPKSPYALSATVTENIGMINSSVGALSLNRQF